MAGFEVRHVLDIKAGLGEAPLWSVEQQALYWVDIEGKTLNRFDPASGANRAWPLPAIPGCFNFREGGLILAANLGYYDFDFASEKFELILEAPFDPKVFRFNDGKADRQGRLWAGTIPFAFKGEPEGTFYRYENGVATPGIPGIMVPNGVAFSPDGTVMYRSESMQRIIYRYDYDIETGTPSNQRVFAEMPDGFGITDGAAVDTEGYYWCALPFGETGKVARFAPDGMLDLHFDMPVLVPTMVSFGGPDMSTLYITSGRLEPSLNRPVSALGGDIFAVETSFTGIAETMTARA